MSHEDKSKLKVNKSEPKTANSAGLDDRLQAHIGSQLKSMYDSYLSAPIPDRLVELLERLDEVSRAGAADDRAERSE
jgi:Anti-sigma factor NepR